MIAKLPRIAIGLIVLGLAVLVSSKIFTGGLKYAGSSL